MESIPWLFLKSVRKVLKTHNPVDVLGIGFGIATGEVSFGTIGSDNRFDLTVVGSSANLSARLCAMAKHGEIKMDANTYNAIKSKTGECQHTVENNIKGFEGWNVDVYTWVFKPGSVGD